MLSRLTGWRILAMMALPVLMAFGTVVLAVVMMSADNSRQLLPASHGRVVVLEDLPQSDAGSQHGGG